jgi:hypothetical protein
MTTNEAADRIRAELDGNANVVSITPRARAKKPTRAVRTLSTVWADEIEIKLDDVGVVDGLLPRTGLAVLYGESGSGKTFAATDMACHIAAGQPWRGLEVEQGAVVYIAAEAPESIRRRLWAWKRHHGVKHLPVLVVQSTVDLLNGDTQALADLVRTVAAERGRVAMVVVDTLARAMTGNENAPDDMGRFVAACGTLREAGETMILVVHHSGKDQARGARGHSCLRAASDVELEITKSEGGGAITVTKARDDAGGNVFGFRLEPVELGTNPKGRTVSTCVAVEAEAPAKRTKAKPLGKRATVSMGALEQALAHAGEAPPACDASRGVTRAVRVTTWRSYFDQTTAYEAGSSARRQAWSSGMEELIASGAVIVWGDWAWLARDRHERHKASSRDAP